MPISVVKISDSDSKNEISVCSQSSKKYAKLHKTEITWVIKDCKTKNEIIFMIVC